MKLNLISSLFISGAMLLSSIAFAASPLDMPEFTETPEAKSIEELQTEIPKLDRAVGAYPAMFFNANHKMQVYDGWTELLGAALILKPTSKEEATQKVHFMAKLFVQGYNMNVTGAAAKAHEAIGFCLKVAPESVECKLLSAMFYMSADVEQLDNVKKTLDELQAQFGKHKNADVEIALAYYYVYANKYDEALNQIDVVDVFFEHLKKDNIKKYRLNQLKEMKVAILNEQAKKEMKKPEMNDKK